ncbi:MAG: hypothetical protein KTR16_12620 [Acidiferrobacterales bacterium]|nr:hypothetical protein [Acidiferrobacterales bacterium]
MKTLITFLFLTFLCLLSLNTVANNAATDRNQIITAINCFIDWDLNGGTNKTVEPCLFKDVVYQRVNLKGELIRYTPGFEYDGKGKDDYVPYITELEIFGNMAIVKTHKHRDASNAAYMKAFILYKLTEGWRITNVVWGGLTPEQ